MLTSRREGYCALVADDEALSRQRLADALRQSGLVRTIIEVDNGDAAADVIVRQCPDMVFLDIQMPGMTGIELVNSIGVDRLPPTVFVTAYDQYAVAAFNANAQDYLLKPFSDERLAVALARLVDRLKITTTRKVETYWDSIVVKRGDQVRLVDTDEIEWIEGAGVNVIIHIAEEDIVHRISMTALAENLDPEHFVRVHRSAILNIRTISYLEPLSHGEFEAVLKSRRRIKISRGYKSLLEARWGQKL